MWKWMLSNDIKKSLIAIKMIFEIIYWLLWYDVRKSVFEEGTTKKVPSFSHWRWFDIVKLFSYPMLPPFSFLAHSCSICRKWKHFCVSLHGCEMSRCAIASHFMRNYTLEWLLILNDISGSFLYKLLSCGCWWNFIDTSPTRECDFYSHICNNFKSLYMHDTKSYSSLMKPFHVPHVYFNKNQKSDMCKGGETGWVEYIKRLNARGVEFVWNIKWNSFSQRKRASMKRLSEEEKWKFSLLFFFWIVSEHFLTLALHVSSSPQEEKSFMKLKRNSCELKNSFSKSHNSTIR